MPATEETVLEYSRRIQPKLADPFHPHPIVKAIELALYSSKGKGDGNYMGMSGDADMHQGVPHLLYAVVIEKRGETFKIVEMTDLMSKVTVSSDMLRRMIDAEIELLNFSRDRIPVDAAVQILDRALSPKTRVVKLDEKDREPAIRWAKQLIDQGRLLEMPQEIVRQIKTLRDSRNWDNLSSETRSTIGSAWARRVGPNTMVVTAVEKDLTKIKIREIIALTLSKLKDMNLTGQVVDQVQG